MEIWIQYVVSTVSSVFAADCRTYFRFVNFRFFSLVALVAAFLRVLVLARSTEKEMVFVIKN